MDQPSIQRVDWLSGAYDTNQLQVCRIQRRQTKELRSDGISDAKNDMTSNDITSNDTNGYIVVVI